MPDFVGIELTKKLPEKAVVGSAYKTEGNVKIFDAVGAPPWVYARVRRKEWYKPEFAEDASYDRGWPVPFTGSFSIVFAPDKEGDYEVTIVATPAPLSLPAVGVFPVLAESDVMKVAVGEKPPAVFRFDTITIDGNSIPLGDHDADSRLLIQKKTTDYLDIMLSYEYVGPKKTAQISVKAGYKDYLGNFTPKTGAYTRSFELPESPETPYTGTITEAIRVPLTACGDIDDGAVEVVAKLPGMPDYISQLWDVYQTKPPVVNFRFSKMEIDGNNIPLANHDADSKLLIPKTTADYLDIVPFLEWQGPRKSATVSIKAGYKDFAGGFSPKTSAYNRSIELPESTETKWYGQLDSPIRVPLTACGGLDDGAVEVVLKISGVSDYISHLWNVYSTTAPQEEIDFDLTQPTASPSQVSPGATVTITCPVKSKCIKAQSVTAKVLIYEGSALPTHGTLLDTKTVSFSISPNQSYNIVVSHVTSAGTIDRRDVGVQLYVSGDLIKEDEWDDVFYVSTTTIPPESDIQNLDNVISGGTYDIGASVPYSVSWQYKGKAQSGQLTISLGTGVYPTFSVQYTFPAISINFPQAMNWANDSKSGSFTLPSTLTPGQTYSIRTRLETADGAVEIDTDWGVITIRSVTPPKADIRNINFVPSGGTYKIGDEVSFYLSFEYIGKAQSGQMVLSLGTGVYPSFFTTQSYNPMAVSFQEAMDWTAKTLTGTFVLTAALQPGQTYNTRAKLQTLEDATEETDTDWGVITISSTPVGVSFQIAIFGIPDFGSYQKWCCYYWDPGTGSFVGDGKWYNSYDKITFANVQPGGNLAVFLKRDSTVSSQYNSPAFRPVSGGSYTYDVQTGVIL